MNGLRQFNKLTSLWLSRRLQSTSTEQYVRTEFEDGVKKIMMCHPKTRNSLSLRMMEHLLKEIEGDRDDAKLRAIVIGGDGPVFSAGHNLKELTPEHGRGQHQKIFDVCAHLMEAIIDAPVPVIARVDGLAAAAGCQLVAQCDMAFCSKESKFSTPGANFGIFCSTPGVALARCVPKTTALKMLLTGNAISSDEAKASGLVTDVFAKDVLDKEIAEVCRAISAKSRSVVELGKKFYYKQVQEDVRKAYGLGGKVMVGNVNMPDGVEGIRSFAEKRKPQWSHK